MTWHDMAMGNEVLLDDIPNRYIVIYLVFSLILTIAYHKLYIVKLQEGGC